MRKYVLVLLVSLGLAVAGGIGVATRSGPQPAAAAGSSIRITPDDGRDLAPSSTASRRPCAGSHRPGRLGDPRAGLRRTGPGQRRRRALRPGGGRGRALLGDPADRQRRGPDRDQRSARGEARVRRGPRLRRAGAGDRPLPPCGPRPPRRRPHRARQVRRAARCAPHCGPAAARRTGGGPLRLRLRAPRQRAARDRDPSHQRRVRHRRRPGARADPARRPRASVRAAGRSQASPGRRTAHRPGVPAGADLACPTGGGERPAHGRRPTVAADRHPGGSPRAPRRAR